MWNLAQRSLYIDDKTFKAGGNKHKIHSDIILNNIPS